MAKVIVRYWRGTTRLEGTATSYKGAMRIASRNQNAYPPTFWDAATGEQLHDDGNGLANPDRDDERRTNDGTIVHRSYVV